MAEVYGVKPKMFTREWWPYFWMYYKWHVIGVLFVIFAIIFTAAQCASRPKIDLVVNYAGHHTFTDEQAAMFSTDMGEAIEDIDKDGHKNVDFQRYVFTDRPGSEEYDHAMQTKLNMEFYNERSYIFLPDEQLLAFLTNNRYYDEVYARVEEWADEMPDEGRLVRVGGNAYAVSLKDSEYLKSAGMNSDMYIMIKKDTKDDELEKAAYKQSVKIANKLIK